jgi:hypothetical protein
MATSMQNIYQFNNFISLHENIIQNFDSYRQLPAGEGAADLNIFYSKAVVVKVLYNYMSVLAEEKKYAFNLIMSCLRIIAFLTNRS